MFGFVGSLLRKKTVGGRSSGPSWVVRTVVVVLAAAALVSTGASSSDASQVSGAVKSITTTPPSGSAVSGTSIRTNISFCVPPGTKQGDTFDFTIPGQLGGYPTSFTLTDPSTGQVVANAVISGTPATATFTFTQYAEQHVNVCGTAYFSAYFNGNAKVGQNNTLTYTTNDNKTFTSVLYDTPVTGVDRTKPHKVGAFNSSTDQCWTNGTDCVVWRVQSPEGPLASGTLTDKVGIGGQTLDCSTETFQIGTPQDSYPGINSVTTYTGGTGGSSCSSTGFTWNFGAVPAGKIVQVYIKANATPHAAGGVSFSNTETATTNVHPAAQSTTVYIASTAGGGQGSGDNVSIVKYSTADGATVGAFDTAPGKLVDANTPVPVTMAVTNSGSVPLTNVTVSDATSAGPALTGLSCDFSKLGGPSSGVTWKGPLAAGAKFTCTGTIPGMNAGTQETDTATVNATGNGPVTASNPFNSYTTSYALGDYVFYDTNHDGVQGSGDKPTPGVTVTLHDSTGKVVGTTTTDSNGHYVFDKLPAGDYTETFTAPSGYEWTSQYSGADTTKDSNVNASGATDVIHLGPSDANLTPSVAGDGVTAPNIDRTIDAGLVRVPAPAVTIVKKDVMGNDADTDATAADLGYAPGSTGLVFTSTNSGNEPLINVVESDTVVANGTVTGLSCDFAKLGGPATGTTWAGPFQPGDSFTCTAQLSGVTAGGADHQDIGKVGGTGLYSGTAVSDTNPYFAKVEAPVSVGDYVWIDANHNGVQDAGEQGIPNVSVTLTDAAGNPVTDIDGKPVGPVQTDSQGLYHFTNLPVGQYITHVGTVPTGLYPTLTGQGPTDTDSSTGSATSAVLGSGQSDETLDFGYWKPAPAITIVKGDANGNAADTDSAAVTLGYTPGSAGLVYTVTNSGTEPLKDITVGDTIVANGTVKNLTCVFPDASTGTTWAGPFAAGGTFTCTAALTNVLAGATDHEDIGAVTGTGTVTGTTVGDTNPYFAKSLAPVSVGDYVWLDTNHNGVQDKGEKGVAGVTVTLTDAKGNPVKDINGNVVGPVETDATGLYHFTDLPAGQYTTRIDYSTTPTGTVPTLAGKGNPATDSSTGSATSAVLSPGESDETLDYGLWAPTPKVSITKGDSNGNAADTAATAAALPDGTAKLVFTIANQGDEPLKNLVVTDRDLANGTVTDLVCVVGGTSVKARLVAGALTVTWAGPLPVGARFACTAELSGVAVGTTLHEDMAAVTATGALSGTGVTDTNPYYAHTPPAPSVRIVKKDAAGHDANTAATAAVLSRAGSTGLVYTVTNEGTEALKNVTVSDHVVRYGTVTGLSCTFPGGDKGTTWAGPFKVGATFTCTAQLTGVQPGQHHEDLGTVTGAGAISDKAVTSSNPYFGTPPDAQVKALNIDTGSTSIGHGPNGDLVGAGIAALLAALGGAVLMARRRRRARA